MEARDFYTQDLAPSEIDLTVSIGKLLHHLYKQYQGYFCIFFYEKGLLLLHISSSTI